MRSGRPKVGTIGPVATAAQVAEWAQKITGSMKVVAMSTESADAGERTVKHPADRSASAQDQDGRAVLRGPIDYWLKLVDRLINERFDELLYEHGVTRREWEMLRLLSTGPATLAELDEALLPFLGPPAPDTSAEQLKELAGSGWVQESGPTYRLTSAGYRSYERIAVVVERSNEAITAEVDPEDFATAVAVLRQMARNLLPGEEP
jgi:hypothetical protein